MSVIKRNLVANVIGNAFTPVLLVVCVPFYTHLLGMEAYGLIGVFMTMYTLFLTLGRGLSMTLTREMSRLSVRPERGRRMRDMLRSLEAVYWAFSIAVGLLIVAAAPLIANYWVQPEELTTATVSRTIMLMGITLLLQFPYSFYTGGLKGLERQVLLAVINSIMNGLRFGGAVLILYLFAPTIENFFIWQVITSAMHTAILAMCVWISLPKVDARPRFRRRLLVGQWRFLIGITGISILSLALTQTDKVVLTRLLTLEQFGFYALAAMIATSVYFVVDSIFTAFSPRLVQLAATDSTGKLMRDTYSMASQLAAATVGPIMAMGLLFSRPLLLIWTGNPADADVTYLILSFLILSSTLNGLLAVPYALQLAHGWTRLTLRLNAIGVIFLIPAVLLAAHYFGGVGTAIVLAVLQFIFVLITPHLTHRRLLKGATFTWYTRDILPPVAVAFVIAIIGWLIMPQTDNRLQMLIWLLAIGLPCLAATALATPAARDAIRLRFKRRPTSPLI